MAFFRVWRLVPKASHKSFNGLLPFIAIWTTSYLSSGPISFHVAMLFLRRFFYFLLHLIGLAQPDGLVDLVTHPYLYLFTLALDPDISPAQLAQ